MSNCFANLDNGKHHFVFSPAPEEPIIHQYLTCIACGERRAISVMGDLLIRQNREWVKLEPPQKGKEQS